MGKWTGRPFGYLEGKEAADDAPVMDNPARLFCRKCRQVGMLVCDEPGFCGNLEPMKPLPDAFEADQPTKPPHTPRHGSKELTRRPKVRLDETVGQKPIRERDERDEEIAPHIGRRPRTRTIPEFEGRLLGKKVKLEPLPDGVEQSWDWFMEEVTPGDWPR